MHRLWAFLKGLGKLVLAASLVLGLFFAWKTVLRFGPGWGASSSKPAPVLYAFHAKVLVTRQWERLTPPEMWLPVPPPLSSPDVQLRLMKWRDEKNWLPLALSHGDPTPKGLRIRTGRMVLSSVDEISPGMVVGTETQCRIRVQVRWIFPDELNEFYRVRELTGLKWNKGLEPGQACMVNFVFVRKGWSWELLHLEAPWMAKEAPATPSPRSFMDWLF